LYVEEKSNKQVSFTQLKSRGLDILSGYIYGLKFENIDKENIKIIFDNNISGDMYEKLKSEMTNVEFGGKPYFVEDLKFKFTPMVNPQGSSKKITVSAFAKNENFWQAYNELLTDAVRKNTKAGNKGLIVPISDLSVSLKNGFVVSSKFDIYIY